MLGRIFLEKMFIGEEPKLIESRYLTMQLARRLPEQIPEEMNVQGGTFKLPSNMLVGRSNSSTFLDSKVSRDMRTCFAKLSHILY